MRRIVERHTLIDAAGFAWDAEVTVPWVWQEGDPESYREPAANYRGDPNPVIVLHTPDDPEHYAYGEEGPRFPLSAWSVLSLLAQRHTSWISPEDHSEPERPEPMDMSGSTRGIDR